MTHGAGDRTVPVDTTTRLLAAHHLRTPSDHLQSRHAAPEACRAAFTGFLDTLEGR